MCVNHCCSYEAKKCFSSSISPDVHLRHILGGGQEGFLLLYLLSVIVKIRLVLAVIGQFTVAVMAKLSELLSVVGKISFMFCCY